MRGLSAAVILCVTMVTATCSQPVQTGGRDPDQSNPSVQPRDISQTEGQRCEHTEKASRPLRLSYTGCRSMKKFQVRHCGPCPDGRCCSPHRTETAPVRFRCRNGNITSRMGMMIESCECDWKCPSSDRRTDALCLETSGKEQC